MSEELEKISANNVLKIIQRANNYFRDSLGGSIIERFDIIVKLIVLKLFDEYELNQGVRDRAYFTIEDNIEDTYDKIKELFIRNINDITFSKLYPNKFKNFTEDKLAVYQVVDLWQKYKFHDAFEDIKGNAFQEILKNTFDKNDNQQFFTPSEISEFIAKLAIESSKNNDEPIRVCDPAVGTGGILTKFAKEFKSISDKKIEIFGADVDERMAWLASINLLLTTGELNNIGYLSGAGSLDKKNTYFENNFFDFIVTNPPFGSDMNDTEILNNYKLGEGKASRRRGVLFIERCIELVKEDGYIIIVIDEGVLNKPSDNDVRKLIREKCNIIGVFSLPDTAFMPYASVKSSILVLKKNKQYISGNTLMVDIESTGRKANGEYEYKIDRVSGRKIIKSDLSKAVDNYKEFIINNDISKKNQKTWCISINKFKDISKQDGYIDWRESRIDTLRYNPTVEEAFNHLKRCKHNMTTLGNILEVRVDTINPSDNPFEEYDYIGLADMEKETGEFTINRIGGETLKSRCNVFCGGDILYSKMRPALKKVSLIPENYKWGICSSEFIVLYVKDEVKDRVNSEFLEWILRTDLVYGQIMGQVTGVGRPRINKKVLLNIKLPIPTLEEQNNIMDLLQKTKNSYTKKKEELINELDELNKNYKDDLIKLQSLLYS